MKRRIVSLISAAVLLTALLSGCGGTGGQNTPPADTQPPASDGTASGKTPSPEHSTDTADAPTVYMTTDISPEGLMAVYEALNWTPTGKVAVKLSTGEPPNSNYLRPELIADVVHEVDGTIVECNTAYGGSRAQTAMHYQVALDQACIDLVYAQRDGDGASLVNRIESRNGLHTLEHAEEIGLGSRTYTLVSIDD